MILAECTCKLVEAVTTQPAVVEPFAWGAFLGGACVGAMGILVFLAVIAMQD